MRRTVLASFVLACSAFAASLPSSEIRGEYLEARTADVYTGPCFANSETGFTGNVAVMGWKIEKGAFQGVPLDGLSVMGVIRAKGTLGDYFLASNPAKAVLILDDRANAEQRLALKAFAQKMGNGLLDDVVRVEAQPIAFSMAGNSVHSRRLTMSAGRLAKLETRPLNSGDQICHNEDVWYQPLTKVDHAMAAYTVANSYSGKGLDNVWSSPEKRSSFVATFHLTE